MFVVHCVHIFRYSLKLWYYEHLFIASALYGHKNGEENQMVYTVFLNWMLDNMCSVALEMANDSEGKEGRYQ